MTEALPEEDRLAANAKALGDTCVYPWNEQGMPGITLRHLYAGMAMQGICGDGIPGSHHNHATTARDAVSYADALLKELAK